MARTKTELSTAVMRKIGLVEALESPSSEDANYIWGEYDDKLSELKDDGLVYWTNTNATTSEIPNAVFPALVKIMGAEVMPAFGLPLDAGLLNEGMMQLRKHISKQSSGEIVETEYF